MVVCVSWVFILQLQTDSWNLSTTKMFRIQYICRSWDYVVLWAILLLLFTILFEWCTTYEGSPKQFCMRGEPSVGFCKAGKKVLCHSLTWNPNFNWKLGKSKMVQDTLMEEGGSLKLCLLDCWNCCVVSQTGSCSFWEILLTGNCHASVVTEYVLKLQSMCARSDVCSLVPRLVRNAWHLMWAWCNRNRTRGFRTESQRLCCSTNCAFNALCVWCSSPNS